MVDIEFAGVDPSSLAVHEATKQTQHMDIRVGTAEGLPFPDASFDVVIFGFCLYLIDRATLPRVVAEADRALRATEEDARSTLVIIDFDPDMPKIRPYRHLEGLMSYKFDYPQLFTCYLSYHIDEKQSFAAPSSGAQADASGDPSDTRIAITVLKRHLPGSYAFEPDS